MLSLLFKVSEFTGNSWTLATLPFSWPHGISEDTAHQVRGSGFCSYLCSSMNCLYQLRQMI